MTTMSANEWQTYSELYGFLGNSLLKPMTQIPAVGLDPAFWEAFPGASAGCEGSAGGAGRGGGAAVVEGTVGGAAESSAEGVAACRRYAQEAASLAADAAVERVAVEYTRLFVGPPSPAAPPWETMHRGGGAGESAPVGFGEATFEMRHLLREAGLAQCGDNNQYEDHLGIELLYLCELCRRRAAGETASSDTTIAGFIERHPLSWLPSLRASVEAAAPNGYFAGLLLLAQDVLEAQVGQLLE